VHDWDLFTREVTWFVSPGATVDVGESHSWRRGDLADLPEVSALLGASLVTPVTVDGTAYELLAWGPADDRRGWLSLPPVETTHEEVHPVHRAFWTSCGGIVERFNEPATWWLNHDDVLTEDAARLAVAPVLHDFRWLWEDQDLQLPIDPGDYYAVGIEANGNLTLAHRTSGQLLLFASDHAFEGDSPLPGCPPYSLMTIDGVPSLASWIETCAVAWQDHHPRT
jgi:hypothetical protein